MAWRFPRLAERTGYVIDCQSFNDNMRPFNDEISAYLNEHNFALNAHSSNTNVEASAVLRITSASQAVNPDIGQSNPPPTATPTDGFKIPTSLQWEAIEDLDVSYTVDDTIVLFIASFQIEASNPAGATTKYGCQFALAIDNRILNETIIGTVDKVIDKTGEGYGDSTLSDPIVVEAVEPVSSGIHRFTVMARMVPNTAYDPFANDDYYMVLNREMIVVEAW